jgi:imidazolonepropionase-like amidohydrolase
MRAALLACVGAVTLVVSLDQSRSSAQAPTESNVVLTNGRWFNGTSFDRRSTTYVANGRFASARPAVVDATIDLGDAWVVPPFAEAHNHNIGSGVEEWDMTAIGRYLADGVFYVKIQGNLPLSEQEKRRLPINRPDAIDVAFAQGSLVSTRGFPTGRTTGLLAQGWFPGHTLDSLRDVRYFAVDASSDLERVWPRVMLQRPDFIKALLSFSEEFEARRNDTAEVPQGLDPRILPAIVAKAHAAKLRLSTHVNTATDFHHAVAAGVDEIVHLPPLPERPVPGRPPNEADTPLSLEDVGLAAERRITVVTTLSLALNRPEATRGPWRERQKKSLALLYKAGVPLAIGSDTPADSSVREALYVRDLGVVDNRALLKMWTETTPQTIFPERRLGALQAGFEASFLALEGNPLEDFSSVRRIRLRFKQGHVLKP